MQHTGEDAQAGCPPLAHIYAAFLAFQRGPRPMAHQMTKAADSMTYRQLCILHLSATKERFNLRQESYWGQGSFSKKQYQIIYEYHDLYNRGLINYGGTAAVALTDVNPGSSTPQALGADIYSQMRLYLIPDEDLEPIVTQLR